MASFFNQFLLMLAPSFYLYVFYNFGTLSLSQEKFLHYPTVLGFYTKMCVLYGSFGAYFCSQTMYAFIEWKDYKKPRDIERQDNEEEDMSD